MNSNSENPRVGKRFQLAVKEWFEAARNVQYEWEKPVPIGNPAKLHKFDLAESTGMTVVECKCYTWTESGNVPSAKMGFTNEAAFYLSFLPDTVEKIIVMSKSTHPRRGETLAEYYFRTYRHLLGNIKVMEFDMSTGNMRSISQRNTPNLITLSQER